MRRNRAVLILSEVIRHHSAKISCRGRVERLNLLSPEGAKICEKKKLAAESSSSGAERWELKHEAWVTKTSITEVRATNEDGLRSCALFIHVHKSLSVRYSAPCRLGVVAVVR